jgi:membrane protein
MRPRELLSLVKQSVAAWVDDSAPSKGAALAYYTTFSIAPLLFIAISIAGLFFGVDAVQGAVFAQLEDLMGENGAQAIKEMLAHVQEPKTGVLSTVIGAVVLLIGASTVFGQLQTALDDIWEAPERAKPSGVKGFIRARLLSFGMVLAIGFLILVSLVFSAAVASLGKWWGPFFGEALGHVVDLVLSFGLLTAGFALIYKYIPSVHIQWRDVWVGAAVTALLFTIGKWAIGLYLGKSSVASSFGAFGSLVIVMVWVYYSAQIFLLGAEFTWVYSHAHGSRQGKTAEKEPEPIKTLPVVAGPLVVQPRQPEPIPPLQRYPGIALAGALIAGIAVRVLANQVKLPSRAKPTGWRGLRDHIFG